MPFELFVALRYLKAKRRQSVISVVTIISIIGVTAGVCALVVALAINNGFREELEKSLLGATANVNLLRAKNDGIRDYEALATRLSRLPHVVACAPALYGEVLASFRSRASGIVLKGIDPQREVHVGDLLLKLREGSLAGLSQSFADADPIILGKELAKSLGAYVGDTILITSPQGYLTPQGIFPKYRHFRVVGVFDSGFYDFDATWAFTNLPAAQRLLDLTDIASVTVRGRGNQGCRREGI
ncbi:MAG: ABC transporter permease [Terriglobia bacterium]